MDPDEGGSGRWRRRLALVAAVALAAAGAVAVAASRDGSGSSTEVVDERVGAVAIKNSFAGRTLLAARESTRGRPMTLRVATSAGSEWLVTCSGVGPQYVLHQVLDGRDERTAPCAVDANIGDTFGFRFGADEPGGNDRELQLWLTEVGATERVMPAEAVLAAAVYKLPEAVRTLAGSEILPIEVSQDQEWTYLDGGESAPGDRVYSRRFGDLAGDSILELVLVGSQDSVVRVEVDGTKIFTDPVEYRLGSTQIGDHLGAGAHTVTLTIVGPVPADARLAIVRRSAA